MSSTEASSAVESSTKLMQLLWPGPLAVQAIHVAAALRIADLIAEAPQTITALAHATNTHGPSLARLLRALASLGVFVEDADGRFAQTELSDALRSDHPASMRPFAMMMGAGFVWRPTGELHTAIRTGEPAFEHVYDSPFFEHLAGHAADAAVFNASMSSLPSYITAIVEAFDFSRFDRIVDVGGGHGALLTAILAANPRAHGVLFDLPAVVAGASVPPAIGDRLEIVAGSFFDAVPGGADAYLLKGIIHDWSDEAGVAILKNCRRAVRPDGRVLIVDTLLTPASAAGSRMMDLLMMVLTRGRERTEPEFRSLLAAAGFALENVIPTAGAAILESRPI